MAYSKTELTKTLEQILNSKQVASLGLPRAAEAAAVNLFLNDKPNATESRIVSEALTDIRSGGQFIYTDNSVLPDKEDSSYCLGCGNDDKSSMTYESHTANGTHFKCECGESVTFN
jgi:hypothetical protein